MANRYFKDKVLTQDSRQVLIAGNLSLSSAAAVSASSFNSLVSSVTKTATGTYQILLSDKYVQLRSVNLTFEGTALNVNPIISSTDVSGAKTIILKTVVGGSVADVAAACKIHVSVLLHDSSVR